jgi:hypothetical protein
MASGSTAISAEKNVIADNIIISSVAMFCVVAIIGIGYGAKVRCRLPIIGLLIGVDARKKRVRK